jgi:ubiquinone biosynthesis protein COQ4
VERIAQVISEATGHRYDPETLIAISPYVKHDKLREWVGYLMLHRLSHAVELSHPVEYATAHMKMVREIIDRDHINALFATQRRADPAVDRFFREKFVSTFTLEDLAQYDEGSLGGTYYRQLKAMGADVALDLGVKLPNESDMDHWVIRGLQLHDLEHLLGGGGFNAIGETTPAVMRCGALFRHFAPELAGLLNFPTYISNLGKLSGTMLYRPELYTLMHDRFQSAWNTGQTSGPYFLARMEDYFHLSIPEARKALGINNVVEADTAAATEVLLDDRELEKGLAA